MANVKFKRDLYALAAPEVNQGNTGGGSVRSEVKESGAHFIFPTEITRRIVKGCN